MQRAVRTKEFHTNGLRAFFNTGSQIDGSAFHQCFDVFSTEGIRSDDMVTITILIVYATAVRNITKSQKFPLPGIAEGI